MKILFRLTSILITAGILLLSNCAILSNAPDDLDLAIRDTSDYLNDNIPGSHKEFGLHRGFLIEIKSIRHEVIVNQHFVP